MAADKDPNHATAEKHSNLIFTVPMYRPEKPETEFLDVIGKKVFLLASHSHLYKRPPPLFELKWLETGL